MVNLKIYIILYNYKLLTYYIKTKVKKYNLFHCDFIYLFNCIN